jgi:hypothetical protein
MVRISKILKRSVKLIKFLFFYLTVKGYRSQGAYRDGKGFEICTAGLEFESGHAPLVRAWDSRSFTPSSEPTKCAFRGGEVSRIQKKKKVKGYPESRVL